MWEFGAAADRIQPHASIAPPAKNPPRLNPPSPTANPAPPPPANGKLLRPHHLRETDRFGVVANERQPALFRIGLSPRTSAVQVFSDGAGRDPDPEFHLQFVGNAFLSPDGVFGGHFPDQISLRTNEVVPLAGTSSARRAEIPCGANGVACPHSHSPARQGSQSD
jgi:hypothetical protein